MTYLLYSIIVLNIYTICTVVGSYIKYGWYIWVVYRNQILLILVMCLLTLVIIATKNP